MKKGVAKRLFNHMIKIAKELSAHKIQWNSDPYTASFYKKMGTKEIGEFKYTLEGNKRVLPSFEVDL
ncbi:MAG: hypothetical protein S4CHLAM7_01850 [Chlamydiae bacterium]|nr:hypothetical protein [Chlamydiota bacterium]